MPSSLLVANKHGTPVPYVPGAEASKSFAGGDGGFGLLYAMSGMAGRNSDLVPSKMGAASAYQLIPAVNRSINLRADAVQSLNWQILDKEGKPVDEGESQEPKTPFGQAMRESQKVSRIALIEQIVYAHDLYGEVYLEPLGNTYRTTGLKWLNPLGMYVMVERGELAGFRWSPQNNDAQTYTFAADELAYDHLYNPFDDYRGMGLVEVAMDTLNISRNLKRWLMGFFRNNARPGQVISPKLDSEFSPTNRNIIKTEVEMFAKGSDNAYSTLVLPIPMDIANYEQPDINQFYAINEPLSTEIYTIFGVPAAMAGDNGKTRYKGGADISQAFYTNTIIPLARWVQDYMNFQVLPYFHMEDTTFAFDLSQFDAASADDKIRADIAVQKFQGELVTRDEARLYAGNVAVGGELGEQYYTPPVPGTAISITNPTPTPPVPPTSAPQLGSGDKPEAAKPAELPAPTKRLATDTAPAYVGLSLADNPQIVALQDALKLLYGDSADVEWPTPDTLHITLVYCDAASDDNLVGIAREINSPSISVHGDKLGIFENGDSRAVYLEVTLAPDLKRLQTALYGQFQARNLPMSAYSVPDVYTPHVTLCYLPVGVEFIPAPVSVHTQAGVVTIGRDDYAVTVRVPLTLVIKSLPKAPNTVRFITETQASAEDELRAWQKTAAKGNALKAFTVYKLPKGVEAFIRGELEAIGASADKALVRAVFDDARAVMGDGSALKDYSSTSAAFGAEVASLIADANEDATTRAAFGGAMRSALRRYGLVAFRDGMKEGGYDPESLSSDDLTIFKAWLAESSDYVSSLGAALFKDGATPNPDVRGDLWVNKSLNDIFFAGLRIGAPNKLATWRLGGTEKHCATCLENDGQTKSVDDWAKQGLPQDRRLDCEGWQCDCGLEDEDGQRLGISTGGAEKSVRPAPRPSASKGLETDEQRRWFFAHVGEGYVARSGGASADTAPSALTHHVITPDGKFEPDMGAPGTTEDSLNEFLQHSNGPLSYAIADPTTGMVSVDYDSPDERFTVNRPGVKSEAMAFVKESQDIRYSKDYLLQLAREHALENGVDIPEGEIEAAYNQQYATRAQAIQHLAKIGDVKLTDAQARRLQTAADGGYLNMVYARDDSERGTLTPTRAVRNRLGGLKGAARDEARRNFQDWVLGLNG